MLETEKICKSCNKKFYVKIIKQPSNVYEKRTSYIICPYCGATCEEIRPLGNEDVVEYT